MSDYIIFLRVTDSAKFLYTLFHGHNCKTWSTQSHGSYFSRYQGLTSNCVNKKGVCLMVYSFFLHLLELCVAFLPVDNYFVLPSENMSNLFLNKNQSHVCNFEGFF